MGMVSVSRDRRRISLQYFHERREKETLGRRKRYLLENFRSHPTSIRSQFRLRHHSMQSTKCLQAIPKERVRDFQFQRIFQTEQLPDNYIRKRNVL